jgi:hypothetical protein
MSKLQASKLEAAIAGALSLLLLSSCGGETPSATTNAAAPADANAAEDAAATADPIQPGAPVGNSAGPVPPPDAVSHPGGYLPPAPAEPETPVANSADPDEAPPATEDQYMRNGQ